MNLEVVMQAAESEARHFLPHGSPRIGSCITVAYFLKKFQV